MSIQKVVDAGGEYLESPDAEEVIAAVEVLARLKGHFGVRNSFTETVDKWVEARPQQPPQDLVDSAIQALDRILTPPSELLELWQEGTDFPGWKRAVLDLKDRVGK